MNTVVGYTGGESTDPSYRSVCAGDGHTEAIRIDFDPEQISYDDLLEMYFEDANCFQSEKPQYKNAIWTHNEEQRQKALAAQEEIGIEVDIDDTKAFYRAEESHQKFVAKNLRGRLLG